MRDDPDLAEYASNLTRYASRNLYYGLACISGPTLTLPQREAAAAIVHIAENYLPPIERKDEYIFPVTLDDFAREDDVLSRRCLPWKSFTETKAYEVAATISRLYGVAVAVCLSYGGSSHPG